MIIVTGGAGFIGSNLVRGLNRLGHDQIIIVDNLTHAIKHLNLNSLQFIDLIDKDEFFSILPTLSKLSAIFHQGACSDTTAGDGRYVLKTNYDASKKILLYALEQRVPFIYASSAAVYGDGQLGFREERTCEYPLNMYAFSKFAFDNYVRSICLPDNQQVTGLRYFNVYGPQENHKGRMASVAFHLFNQLTKTGTAKVFQGSETLLRDFVFVDDVVDVNLHFLESRRSGIFNCGAGRARSFADLACILLSMVGRGSIETIPFPADLRGKYQAFTQADLTRLRGAGYEREFVGLEGGLARYVSVLKATGGYYRS